jgi:hypothetical protein
VEHARHRSLAEEVQRYRAELHLWHTYPKLMSESRSHQAPVSSATDEAKEKEREEVEEGNDEEWPADWPTSAPPTPHTPAEYSPLTTHQHSESLMEKLQLPPINHSTYARSAQADERTDSREEFLTATDSPTF